jgi:nucleoside-diphosphate-sugar epimerase
MNSRVLVTGIDGFTGRYLAPALRVAGYEVHGMVAHTRPAGVDGAQVLHQCDLLDEERVLETVEAVQPKAVVHLAAVSFVGHGDIDAMYRVNVLGTRHLLQALAKPTAAPESVLLASSANVYGNSTEGVMNESTPPAPANDYAVSKLAMEYLARLYSDTLPIVIVRPFNYTGVGQAHSFLLPKIVEHVRRGAHTIELGNLDVARDFSDVRTVTQAYIRLLSSRAAIGRTLNVCSGRAHTVQEVLALVKEVSGCSLDVRVNPSLIRHNDVKILLGSRARLDECIGPIHNIELRDTLAWMLGASQ